MRAHRPPTTDVRASMIQAARNQLAAGGVAQISLRAISREVGVSHQAAAHHFGDRAGLFTALATEGFLVLLDDVSAARLSETGSVIDHVAAVGASYVRFSEKHPAVFDVMFRPELLHADDPGLVEAEAQVWSQLLIAVTDAREQGWGGTVPTETMALLCWSSMHGLATLRRDSRMADLVEELSVEGLVRLMAAAVTSAG